MIVLKKINNRVSEKVIQVGQTAEFFRFDLNDYESFDWNVKILSNGQRGITKISSLYDGTGMESTKYAFLGKQFHTEVNILVSVDNFCVFEITNNELLAIRCSVKVKIF